MACLIKKLMIFLLLSGVLSLVSSKPCDPSTPEHGALTLSFTKKLLLHSQEDPNKLPNPSIHLALRMAPYHNQGIENDYLGRLKTQLHNDLQNSLSKGRPVTGLVALYILALKASCYDISTVTFNEDHLIHHLKKQMEQEKEHIAATKRPLTNYYQYSLGILAQCVSGVRVSLHVRNKLIHAIDQGDLKHGNMEESVDTLAMAGMALQCVKESNMEHVDAQLQQALTTVKGKLLASQRPDGHMGNEFSTGLAVQALLAMGSEVSECSQAMEAMRTSARNGIYHNPMAISQVLPALHQRSYLQLKAHHCTNEDDSVILEPKEPTVEVSDGKVSLQVEVEVVNPEGHSSQYFLDVPKGSSILEALELLQQMKRKFVFETEPSLWGSFLSVVNGVRARQSDRSYWHISSDGTSINEGISDFKILHPQKITIKKTRY
ncbi:transcobalamin-2 isoform X1 [Scleropages formosus]|uniref:Transcobalamin II n=2 Tax=Scleropages formosus TaxID=113540 RepID=A0A8C9QTX1_SCLFO|nr:transcobalamin-2-like isoform X1 [Scleropages formosus]XP_018604475.1 transcobalamin-2-like isoform X1 [Scleropages formosus]XP_018604477.1 transcobalamin-2-like isoform X1 [Scleropages formosus]XP_018604478.1 transcobalamin-2-like isoform X1 [Scleropages formosus]